MLDASELGLLSAVECRIGAGSTTGSGWERKENGKK
jgi:hypothetical protein